MVILCPAIDLLWFYWAFLLRPFHVIARNQKSGENFFVLPPSSKQMSTLTLKLLKMLRMPAVHFWKGVGKCRNTCRLFNSIVWKQIKWDWEILQWILLVHLNTGIVSCANGRMLSTKLFLFNYKIVYYSCGFCLYIWELTLHKLRKK